MDLIFDPEASEVPQLTPEKPFDQVFKLDGIEVTRATTKQDLIGRTSRPMSDFAGNRPGVYIHYAKHHVSLEFTKDRKGLMLVRISVNPQGVFGGKR